MSLTLFALAASPYRNKVDPWDMPTFQVTEYNPITIIPPAIGNFTLNVTFPFVFSKDQSFTDLATADKEFLFFHCFFDEDETMGI